ncbi:DUF4097 family beta strand repeat-containing protein [Pedobacter montanisoli]|uniref:Adhesin domain-containing protein n=1 Tax=Pedobacter montanisoli TaxID=2923277 RepID=A0ABS9ZSJ3_9SPHI|nr:hypothetical protein [Pedobacter montanisoli]MCJ0741541.1 hypothetical protein [Pedobacter montanisoli]
MKKLFLIVAICFATALHVLAQKEFKVAKTNGKLIINNLSNLTIEGYEGKEIIFTILGKKETSDPRAQGLSALSSVGFDNTGVGLSLKENGQNTEISPIESFVKYKVTVKIPYSVALSIKTTSGSSWSLYQKDKDSASIVISNLKSEVDASLQYENIKVSNIKGPLSIKTFQGNIESTLTPDFKGPISLISAYGFIDFTIPPAAKADLSISTAYGTLYAPKDLNLTIQEEKQTPEKSRETITANGSTIVLTGGDAKTATVISGSATSLSSSNFSFAGTNLSNGTNIKGSLNGGGEKIILKSSSGKIYVRK